MNTLWRIGQYLQYCWRALGRHGVHSPFVYVLADQVLPHKQSAAGTAIDALRTKLLHDTTPITIQDHGAGYAADGKRARKLRVCDVARSSARRRRSGLLLLRLCQHLQPQAVLELGTNLGFSALYQCAGLPATTRFITVEGSHSLAVLARQHLAQLGHTQVQVWHTTFEAALASHELGRLDYVLLDGHHTYDASLHYFGAVLPRLNPGAVFILDDIYWSPGMALAWRQLCAHPAVSLSIDIYEMGLLFVGRPQARQHFVLRR